MSEETPNEELDLDLSDPQETDFDPTADPTLDLDLEGDEHGSHPLDLEV